MIVEARRRRAGPGPRPGVTEAGRQGKFGSLEVWTCGSLEVWKVGSLEVWKFGSLEVWKFGSLEVWKLGSLEAWKLGSLEVWKFGSLEVWKFGCPGSVSGRFGGQKIDMEPMIPFESTFYGRSNGCGLA